MGIYLRQYQLLLIIANSSPLILLFFSVIVMITTLGEGQAARLHNALATNNGQMRGTTVTGKHVSCGTGCKNRKWKQSIHQQGCSCSEMRWWIYVINMERFPNCPDMGQSEHRKNNGSNGLQPMK